MLCRIEHLLQPEPLSLKALTNKGHHSPMANFQLTLGPSAQSPSPRHPWELPTYSPTSLNQYGQCPEAFLHERVLKTPAAENQASVALGKGSATHVLLERYLGSNSTDRASFVTNLSDEAARALGAQGLSIENGAEFDRALAYVVAWTSNGIDVLETEYAGAALLIGEQFLDFRWNRAPTQFRLLAKIDLLAVFADGAVDSLDWKTGASRDLNQVQNAICRLVAEANAPQLFSAFLPGGQPVEIRTTVCHLGTRELTTQVFDHPQLATEFAAIRDQIIRIEQAKADPTPGTLTWRPQPGPLCRFCKHAHACSYYAVRSDGGGMTWLDDALNQLSL